MSKTTFVTYKLNVLLLNTPNIVYSYIGARSDEKSVLCLSVRSNNSRRFRAIHSRLDPVKWRTRRVTPFGKAGMGSQAAGPPDRSARASGRSGLLAAGRPAPAGGPHHSPPARTETTRVPAAVPVSWSPCHGWSPRPLVASWRAPASPPFAAPRASSSRFPASTAEVAVSTFGAPKAATS